MPLTNDHGYTTLFDAAAKGEAGLFMLVPGDGESREYNTSNALLPSGPRLLPVTVSRTRGRSLRRCVW